MKKFSIFILLFILLPYIFIGCQDKDDGTNPLPPENTATYTVTPIHTITSTYTVTPILTITPTYTVTPTCVIGTVGNDGLSHTGTYQCSSRTVFQKFSFTEGFVVDKIYIYSMKTTAGFRMGLYSDDAGCPDTLLTSNATYEVSGVSDSWFGVDVPNYTIPTTGDYWLAMINDAGSSASFGISSPAAGNGYRSIYNVLLPESVGSGCTFDESSSSTQVMIYAEGCN